MIFSDLLPELESEILSRVPATSLMHLKTTCKRWYVLFKDSSFVEKNLANGKAATQVMLKQYGSDFWVSVNMHGLQNPNIEFTCKRKTLSLKNSEHGFEETHSNYKQLVINEIFQCNGLLLCTTYDNRFAVWNPCTGQIRWIHTKRSCYRMHQKYFLGYENKKKSLHSYKILTFNNHYNGQVFPVPDIEIYELSTDSWQVLDDVTHDWCIESKGVTWKGNAYCFATNIKEPLLTFMLKFDFTTERFERLSLPFQSEFEDDFVFLSVIGEEKLALLRIDERDSSAMRIWVTNTKSYEDKDLTWSPFLVVDLYQFETFMGGMTRNISFLVDEENKMVVCCDNTDKNRTEIYIFGEDIYKQVYKGTEKGLRDHPPLLVSYVPSLVQIPARQNISGGKRKR